MGRTFSGATANAGSVILGAQFWQPGKKVVGIYIRSFQTSVGVVHEFTCPTMEVEIDEQLKVVPKGKGKTIRVDRFAMGALTGFEMALQDAAAKGFESFKYGDQLSIECVGMQKAEQDGYSDMPEFKVDIFRN